MPDDTSPPHRTLVDGWLERHASPHTRAAYRTDVELFATWCTSRGVVLLAAETHHVVAFQTAREVAGDIASTIRRRRSALSSFYTYAVAAELREHNPSAGAARPKTVPGDPSPTARLSAEAVSAHRAAAAAFDPRLEALVALIVLDGLKVGEALALDIEDLSRRSSALTITVQRRGQISRKVVADETALAIRRCIRGRRSGPVFVSERSASSPTATRLTRFGVDHLFRQLRAGNDAPPVTASALRRFHMTERHQSGDALEDVRIGAGLAHVRSVRRYVDR